MDFFIQLIAFIIIPVIIFNVFFIVIGKLEGNVEQTYNSLSPILGAFVHPMFAYVFIAKKCKLQILL